MKAIFIIVMYVCCCLAVTDSEIEGHIQAGAASLEAVMLCTRAGTRCGSCRSEIAAMIAAADARSHVPSPSPGEPDVRLGPDGRHHLAVTSAEAPAPGADAPKSAA